MKGTRVAVLTLLLVFSVLVMNADAKWWIFGTSEDEVETSYLFLNKVAFSELGNKVTLYRDMLPMGTITIQGKGTAGRNKVGAVRITLDNKETWQDVKLSESGAFEFTFRPEMNRTYKVFVEVIDTTGKTNKIENTYKELNISQINIQAVVRDALDRMIDAYQREVPTQFMALVADDFAADKVILDRAIRKDFTAFDNIIIRYTLNNVASDATGKVYANISYSRMVTSTRSGKSLSDKGSTEFTFKVGDAGLRIFSMKIPLIFGLSDASNVATGITNIGTNDPIILVDAKGTVTTVPFNQAAQAIQSGSTSEGGQITLRSTCGGFGCQNQGLSFQGTIVGNCTPGGGEDICLIIQPFQPVFPMLFLKPGTSHYPLGQQAIETITSVPNKASYRNQPEIPVLQNMNNTFALYLPNNKYAVIQFKSFSDESVPPNFAGRFVLRFKYQPDGTPNF